MNKNNAIFDLIEAIMCILLAASLVITLLMAFAAVIKTEENEDKIIASINGGMEAVGSYEGIKQSAREKDRFTYYRETTTDVMYICYEEYRKGSLTVMMDPETGLPQTYSRYMELTEKDEED